MTKYKIKVSIEENNSFWIVVDDGRFIRSPTQEDLKGAKITSYSKDNICPICREENSITDKSILYPRNANHDMDKNGNKIDEWVCKRHSLRNYHRYDSDSYSNIRKSMSACRTGGLQDHTRVLGDNCEELTNKLFGVKRLSVEYDKYSQLPLDHSPIPNGISMTIEGKLVDLSRKIPLTRGRYYDPNRKCWSATSIERDWHKEFDILVFYCVSEDGNTIERIYIIPKYEIIKRKCISACKNTCYAWYEKYKVSGEEYLKNANKFWDEIISRQKI